MFAMRKAINERNDVVPARGAARMAFHPPDGYGECRGEIAIRLGHFFLRYLSRLYREFDGDLALPIVLGEIAHHNITRFYSAHGPLPLTAQAHWFEPKSCARLTPCNAFSLSAATGIPRETVRRKIATLVKRGWVKRNAKGEVVLVSTVARHFQPDLNVQQLLSELLELNDQLKATLASANRNEPRTA